MTPSLAWASSAQEAISSSLPRCLRRALPRGLNGAEDDVDRAAHAHHRTTRTYWRTGEVLGLHPEQAGCLDHAPCRHRAPLAEGAPIRHLRNHAAAGG